MKYSTDNILWNLGIFTKWKLHGFSCLCHRVSFTYSPEIPSTTVTTREDREIYSIILSQLNEVCECMHVFLIFLMQFIFCIFLLLLFIGFCLFSLEYLFVLFQKEYFFSPPRGVLRPLTGNKRIVLFGS